MIIPNKVKSGDAITAKMFNQLIDYVKSITPQDGGHSAGTRLTRGTNGFTVSSSPVPTQGAAAAIVPQDTSFLVYIEEIKTDEGIPTGTWRGYVREGQVRYDIENIKLTVEGLELDDDLNADTPIITWRTVLPTDLFYLEVSIDSNLNIISSKVLSTGNNDTITTPYNPDNSFGVLGSYMEINVDDLENTYIQYIRIPIATCTPDPDVSTTPVVKQLLNTDLQLYYGNFSGFIGVYFKKALSKIVE